MNYYQINITKCGRLYKEYFVSEKSFIDVKVECRLMKCDLFILKQITHEQYLIRTGQMYSNMLGELSWGC